MVLFTRWSLYLRVLTCGAISAVDDSGGCSSLYVSGAVGGCNTASIVEFGVIPT
jgi:hypothetical protein